MDASLKTWQVGPENRWAYQHVGELIPTVVVPRGTDSAWGFVERAAALDDVSFDRGDGTTSTLAEFLDTGYVDGLAVAHGGALVLERYRNDMRAETLHLSQSVGKSVLGLLVGAACRRGSGRPG